MAAPAATTATPPFASRQQGGEGLFALKSLASARPAGPGQQRSLRQTKPVLSAGKSKILAVWRRARRRAAEAYAGCRQRSRIAGRLDHVVEGHALHQRDDLCALPPAARRAGLALSLSRLAAFLGPLLPATQLSCGGGSTPGSAQR